jgi:hypothetical protein
MESRLKVWRGMVVVLLLAWLSTLTMLIPWPPATIDLFKSQAIPLPSIAALWTRWIVAFLFVLCGVLAALFSLRGSRRAGRVLLLLSLLYIGYWVSEYLLASRPISDGIDALLRQVGSATPLAKAVIIQHQVILPLVHLGCLAIAAITRLPVAFLPRYRQTH